MLGCAGKPTPAPENPPPAPVQVATTQEITMGEWTDFPGATQPLPNRSARITAAVEGRVVWLLHDPAAKDGQAITEGQQIQKGQVIGQLDDHLVRANRDKVQATIKETKELQNQSELAVKTAEIKVNNLQSLLNTSVNGSRQVVSPVQLQEANLALETAKSKQRETDARLEGLQNDVKALDEQLDLFKLKAPITGRLGAIQAVPGQTLAIGAIVAEVLDLDDIDLLCYAPPRTADKLALGQKARVVGEKQDNPAQRGTITFIAVQAQPDTGSFAVKVRFPNRERQLRSGSVMRVEVLTKPEQPRVAIDEAALLEDQDPPSVVIVRDLKEIPNEETGKIEKIGYARKLRAITGVRDRRWKRVEILKLEDPETKEEVPLTDDVLFVTKGAAGLEGDSKEGDKVKIEEDED